MASLSVEDSATGGLTPTFNTANAGGDEFSGNDGRVILIFKNDDGSSKTVTIDSKQDCSHGFDHDASVTVDANGIEVAGPFDVDRWSDPVSWTYSDVTSLSVAVVKVPAAAPSV